MKTSTIWVISALISLGTYAQQSKQEITDLTAKEKEEIHMSEAWQQLHAKPLKVQTTTTSHNRAPISNIVPTAGASETFTPSTGDYFLDPGGFGGSTTFGTTGNYPNCGCDTFTTLAGVVEIQFIYFSVFSTYDYLIIYDGMNSSGTVLYDNSAGGINEGDKNLTDMIASHGSDTFISKTGSLFFEFHATTTVDYGGWDSYIARTVDLEMACGDGFLDTGGTSNNYGFLENITFKVEPDNPGEAASVNFTAFDVEANWDALYVYDGPNDSYPLIDSGNPATSSGFPAGGYYGNTPPGPFTSTHASGMLTFVFRSDNAVTFDGWEASVSCVPLQPSSISCGNDFFDTGGSNGEYWFNEVLTTTVIPPSGQKATVTFSLFDVEVDYDALYVYDGPNDSAPLISSGNPVTYSGFPAGGFYGSNLPGPFTSTHPSGALTFVFMSDDDYNNDGWEASVSCSPLGIAENSIEGFSFYPNPVNDRLHLKAFHTIERVGLFNLLGEKVMSLELGSSKGVMNTSSLSKGVYLMKINMGKKTGVYKIIKN